jgi:hypothetical protein
MANVNTKYMPPNGVLDCNVVNLHHQHQAIASCHQIDAEYLQALRTPPNHPLPIDRVVGVAFVAVVRGFCAMLQEAVGWMMPNNTNQQRCFAAFDWP